MRHSAPRQERNSHERHSACGGTSPDAAAIHGLVPANLEVGHLLPRIDRGHPGAHLALLRRRARRRRGRLRGARALEPVGRRGPLAGRDATLRGQRIGTRLVTHLAEPRDGRGLHDAVRLHARPGAFRAARLHHRAAHLDAGENRARLHRLRAVPPLRAIRRHAAAAAGPRRGARADRGHGVTAAASRRTGRTSSGCSSTPVAGQGRRTRSPPRQYSHDCPMRDAVDCRRRHRSGGISRLGHGVRHQGERQAGSGAARQRRRRPRRPRSSPPTWRRPRRSWCRATTSQVGRPRRSRSSPTAAARTPAPAPTACACARDDAPTAPALGCSPDAVLVASTGVIGVKLVMPKVAAGITNAAAALSPDGGADAARAIMTTDPFSKEAAAEASSAARHVQGRRHGQGLGHDRAHDGDDARVRHDRRAVSSRRCCSGR